MIGKLIRREVFLPAFCDSLIEQWSLAGGRSRRQVLIDAVFLLDAALNQEHRIEQVVSSLRKQYGIQAKEQVSD